MEVCKNCNKDIATTDAFCKHCGAQIIRKRITVKSLFSNLLQALGWDSNFFITLRHLLYRPKVVLHEFITGTRKKYANPFTFYAILTAASLFIFSFFMDQFIEMSSQIGFDPFESSAIIPVDSLESKDDLAAVITDSLKIEDNMSLDTTDLKDGIHPFGFKDQAAGQAAFVEFQLKYYNFFAFLFIPVYTFLSFLVFRKPYNFGEHLVINAYLQGITTLFTILLFIFGLVTGINIFVSGIIPLSILYYSFAYAQLYQFNIWQLFLRFLKFVGILLLMFLVIVLVIGIGVAVYKIASKS